MRLAPSGVKGRNVYKGGVKVLGREHMWVRQGEGWRG